MKTKIKLCLLITVVALASVIVFSACSDPDPTLSFESNGGTACASLTIGGSGQSLPTPTRDKYDFAGWYFDDGTFSRRVTDSMLSDGSISSDTKVYANWEKNVFTVSLYADGQASGSLDVAKGAKITEPDYPVRDGYAFYGWFADAELKESFDFTAAVGSDSALYGKFVLETSVDKFTFIAADDYFDKPCYGITGVAEGATLPEEVIIPSVYNDKPVVCIFDDAFKEQAGIKTVYIPDSVTAIASDAFRKCTALENVRMSREISEVGDGAFLESGIYNNSPNGYVYVGSVLAGYKGSVPENFEVTVKEGTRVITDRVFWLNTNVVKVNLPASLVYVGFNAFLRAPVREYTVPATSEYYTIKDGALFSKDMTHLVYYPVGSDGQTYTVPDTVVSIGDEAFQHLYHLVKLIIPDSVKTIGDGVCDESVTLEEVVFGAGIEKIGDGVFNAPKALKRITVKSPVPFEFGVCFLTNSTNFKIYVADQYLDTYKTAENWKAAASRMYALSELTA